MMNSGSFYKTNSPITLLSTFPQIILETLELLLAKLIQLAQELQSMPLQTVSLAPQPSKTNLINIYERKNIPTSRKAQNNIAVFKGEFENILAKLTQYKNSSSFDKKMNEMSPLGYNSFEYEEMEINLMKVEEGLKKDIGEVRVRLTTIQDDIGQILLLYKDLIFDR